MKYCQKLSFGLVAVLVLLAPLSAQAGSFDDNKENCLEWDLVSETDFYDRIKSCTFVLGFKDLPDELRRSLYSFRSIYYAKVGSEDAAAADIMRSLSDSSRELVGLLEKLGLVCLNENSKFKKSDQELACDELKKMTVKTSQ